MRKARNSKNRRMMRHARVRRNLRGSSERPRLAVFRSLNHVYAQVIDDDNRTTLAAASSLDGPVKEQKNGNNKADVSKLVGTLVAQRAKEKGINSVVFDRGGYKYHGRIKSLADAARKEGLVF
jgi:large subunit ribosomal protein L18